MPILILPPVGLATVHRPALAYVGFAKQTVKGTAVAPTKFSRWQSMGPFEDKVKMGVYRGGFTRDYEVALKEAQWQDGQFTGWMYPDSTTALLAYFLGGTDVVTGGSDPYTHTFNEASVVTNLPYITFEHSMGTDQEVDRVQDCRVDGIKIEAKAGGLVSVQVMIRGAANNAQNSMATVTYETDRPATYVDAALTFTGLDVASLDVTDLQIDMKNASEQVFTLGGVYPVEIQPAAREFAVQFTVYVPDNKLYREVFFGSSSATTGVPQTTYLSSLEANFQTVTDSPGPGRKIDIVINNIEMEDAKPLYDNSAKSFVVTAKGKAVFNGSTICQVVAENSVSSAYV